MESSLLGASSKIDRPRDAGGGFALFYFILDVYLSVSMCSCFFVGRGRGREGGLGGGGGGSSHVFAYAHLVVM